MKSSLWIVIIITISFLGFLMGYSLPPFIEAGVIGGGPNKVKAGQELLDKETKDYYKNLLKEE